MSSQFPVSSSQPLGSETSAPVSLLAQFSPPLLRGRPAKRSGGLRRSQINNRVGINWLLATGYWLLLAFVLTACDVLTVTNEPAPVLVTLPMSTRIPATITPTSPPTVTPIDPAQQPTLIPTQPPPPTPEASAQGIGATAPLWEWSETARPAALSPASSRLAALIADGRFAWLDANTGRVQNSVFLWEGIIQGESWGEVYSDGLGNLAVVAAREQRINPATQLADTRARIAVYNGSGDELWSLPELESQHFYSATLTSISVVVGSWPYGFIDNKLAAYELFSGQQLWEVEEEQAGFQQIINDGNRLYVLVNTAEGTAVAAYDLRTGEALWRWSDFENMPRPDLIGLDDNHIYAISFDRIVALDPTTGRRSWAVGFNVAPEAGLGTSTDFLYMAPAPAFELGFRPGVVALRDDGSGVAWHSLNGLVADPVAANEDGVWTIVKDYDEGQVMLSGLELDTGLERVRLPVSTRPDELYQIVTNGRRVFVLGESLWVFGY